MGEPSPPASAAVVALDAVLAESSCVPPGVDPVVVARVAAPWTGHRLLQHVFQPVHPWIRSGSTQISEPGRHDLLQPKDIKT